jgi:hypothetical protein
VGCTGWGLWMAENKPPRVDYSKLRIQKTKDQVHAEDLIAKLEKELEHCKLQHQLYFIGTLDKPPREDLAKLERLARHCRGHIPTRTMERFRMHNLLTKVVNYMEHWSKTIRKIEEGEAVSWAPISMRMAAEAAEGDADRQAADSSNNGKESSGYLACLKDPLCVDEEAEVRKVYNSYVAARAKIDANTKELPFGSFQRALAKQVQTLMSRNAKGVQFRIEINDGKVSLKAKPVRE